MTPSMDDSADGKVAGRPSSRRLRDRAGTPMRRSRPSPRRPVHRLGLCAALATALFGLGGCFPGAKPPSQPIDTGSPFLGPKDFVGGYSPRSGDAQDGGQATYAGALVVTMLDRTLVEQVLPAGLRLATPIAGSTRHPVIYLMGTQAAPQVLTGGVPHPVPSMPPYREMILLVPFVVGVPGVDRWHNYAVRMYLDYPGPVVIGDVIYAYGKQLASFDQTGALPDVNTQVYFPPYITRYFASDIRSTGPWRSAAVAAASLPRWPDLQEVFAMPVVGWDTLRFVCSYWEWEYTNAEVAPVTSSHRFVESFRAGMANWVTLGPLANAPDGAVALRGLRWRLAWPPLRCLF
jgi:hypothetical protein